MKRTTKRILTCCAMLLLAFVPLLSARADSEGLITGNMVNLRSEPSTSGARLAYLYRGDTVAVTGETNGWYAVTHAGQRGYVYGAYVSLSSAAENRSGSITGDKVNLRSKPSTSGARLAYLYRGDTVAVTGETNGWYAVTHGDQRGYVYSAYVSLSSAGASGSGSSASSDTVLRYGSRGEDVRELQNDLILLGYLSGSADGVYGAKTRSAVTAYQSRNGLAADGAAGNATRSAATAEAFRIRTVVDTAKSFLGTPYVYGGSSPATGFDCSGLTQYAFRQAGLSIPRVSYEQAAAGIAVPKRQIRVGDLVAFNDPVSHVGIYIGNGKFIHAPHTGDVVKISSLSAMKLTAIRRFTGVLAK